MSMGGNVLRFRDRFVGCLEKGKAFQNCAIVCFKANLSSSPVFVIPID
jgi:hypothetical protein